jgi:hypothetical protein
MQYGLRPHNRIAYLLYLLLSLSRPLRFPLLLEEGVLHQVGQEGALLPVSGATPLVIRASMVGSVRQSRIDACMTPALWAIAQTMEPVLDLLETLGSGSSGPNSPG